MDWKETDTRDLVINGNYDWLKIIVYHGGYELDPASKQSLVDLGVTREAIIELESECKKLHKSHYFVLNISELKGLKEISNVLYKDLLREEVNKLIEHQVERTDGLRFSKRDNIDLCFSIQIEVKSAQSNVVLNFSVDDFFKIIDSE